MRYTPLATDALCPMPYALCPMPARAPHVTEKGYTLLVAELRLPNKMCCRFWFWIGILKHRLLLSFDNPQRGEQML